MLFYFMEIKITPQKAPIACNISFRKNLKIISMYSFNNYTQFSCYIELRFSLAKKDVQTNCGQKVDVGFILDSSKSLGTQYAKKKEFLKAIAAQFGVNQNTSRIGVISFSYFTELSIKLNEHDNLHTFNKAVDDIPYMGSTTRIDKALRLTQSELFDEKNGARFQVNKILILLTDGSQTQESDAEDPVMIAQQIRDSSIQMLTVGIGPGTNQLELSRISGSPQNTYSTDSFDTLLENNFLKSVSKAGCKKGMVKSTLLAK